ncbi:glucosaminidase domain-containing protein [Sediminibacterium sp.]|uniref:glucosaminidase domain-containing protein n=1 Tax=Sediminibacterium sp. TaxID=1917865 RepID=UPI003F7020A0
MKLLFSILGFILIFSVDAQQNKTLAYIEQYKEIAIAEMIRSGVPASITLAQGVLESQSGESPLVKRSNNHFGIKCKPEWTGARTFHDDDEKGECFRVYDSPIASFKDHSDFLKSRAHYQFLFKLSPTDSDGWAKGLKKAGYATAKTYPQKLIKIIKDYNLDQYNTIALARINNQPTEITVSANRIETPIAVIPEPEKTKEERQEDTKATNDSETFIPLVNKNKEEKVSKYGHLNFPEGLFTINQTGVLYAKAGTSLLAIANQHNISLSKLLLYNDLVDIDILTEDQLIYIERKQKKGEQEYYVAKQGETLNDIAQLTGVRLEYILQYNKLEKSISPIPGTKVYLKSPIITKTTPFKK